MSDDFKVAKQCAKVAKKGYQVLGLISRSFSNKRQDIILKLYKSLVRPHLDRPLLKLMQIDVNLCAPHPKRGYASTTVNITAELSGFRSQHCCVRVPNCNSDSRYDADINFHGFPANAELRKQWIVKIKRDIRITCC